jgi:hypothetical protein
LDYNAIHRIPCENSWQKMWDQFVFFESEPTARQFLTSRYSHLDERERKSCAYRNTQKLIYLSKQAREFFNTGMNSNILVRPLLFYYGMVNLAKMLILTLDPWYPSHTSLLAHGVTTRKIKKAQYEFMEDEIKVQKDGLIPHLIQLIADKKVRETYRMKELLSLIPELSMGYERIYHDTQLVPVYVHDEMDASTLRTEAYFPISLLDERNVTLHSFCEWVNGFNKAEHYFEPGIVYQRQGIFSLYWRHSHGIHGLDSPNGFSNHLFFRDLMGRYYVWNKPEERLMLPEIIHHLLVMYLLGMLCRYEGDLWGEIHFSFHSQDLYVIHEFMNLSPRKYPNLILNLMFQEVFIFHP